MYKESVKFLREKQFFKAKIENFSRYLIFLLIIFLNPNGGMPLNASHFDSYAFFRNKFKNFPKSTNLQQKTQ